MGRCPASSSCEVGCRLTFRASLRRWFRLVAVGVLVDGLELVGWVGLAKTDKPATDLGQPRAKRFAMPEPQTSADGYYAVSRWPCASCMNSVSARALDHCKKLHYIHKLLRPECPRMILRATQAGLAIVSQQLLQASKASRCRSTVRAECILCTNACARCWIRCGFPVVGAG
jgi:hypothetical protein